jgi:hypothetical protein
VNLIRNSICTNFTPNVPLLPDMPNPRFDIPFSFCLSPPPFLLRHRYFLLGCTGHTLTRFCFVNQLHEHTNHPRALGTPDPCQQAQALCRSQHNLGVIPSKARRGGRTPTNSYQAALALHQVPTNPAPWPLLSRCLSAHRAPSGMVRPSA